MSLANLHWYGWVFLTFAISSTMGLIWKSIADFISLFKGLTKNAEANCLIPAILIALTLYCLSR